MSDEWREKREERGRERKIIFRENTDTPTDTHTLSVLYTYSSTKGNAYIFKMSSSHLCPHLTFMLTGIMVFEQFIVHDILVQI